MTLAQTSHELDTERYVLGTFPMLYLPLWKRDGDTVISDDAYGHAGSVTGAVWTPQGRTFDGTDDYIDIVGLPALLASLTVGTIEVWTKSADNNVQPMCLAISNNASAAITELQVAYDWAGGNNRLEASVLRDGSAKWLCHGGSGTVTSGDWYHFVVTHNGTTPALFLNGAAQSLTFVTSADKTVWFKGILTDATADATVVTIGALRRNGSVILPHNGTIGEVRIYSRLLSAEEVLWNYLATKWRFSG